MEILEAFDKTKCAHSAAKLAGCDPKTVRRLVARREAGVGVDAPIERPRLVDGFTDVVDQLVDGSDGVIRADVAHEKLVACGYADGYPRSAGSTNANVGDAGIAIVAGKRCPFVGRVSMDFTTVGLEYAPDAEVGDEVVCLGQGTSVQEWARISNSITYEIICSFGSRVERRYV